MPEKWKFGKAGNLPYLLMEMAQMIKTLGMSLKCPNCGTKVNSEWLLFSSARSIYRCVNCCSLIGWNNKYKRMYPAAVLVVVAVLITIKSLLVDNGLFVDIDFTQNIFVLAGMLFLVLFLKLFLPLQRFLTVIEAGKK